MHFRRSARPRILDFPAGFSCQREALRGPTVLMSLPLFWLRIATVLYGVGLVHAILMLRQRGERFAKFAAPAVCLGMIFHFVSIVESALVYGYAELLTIRHAESALALLIAVMFTIMFVRYRTASPAL